MQDTCKTILPRRERVSCSEKLGESTLDLARQRRPEGGGTSDRGVFGEFRQTDD